MKKSLYILVLIIIAILLAVLLLRPTPEPEPAQVPVEERMPLIATAERVVASPYYLSADGQYLVPVNLDITATTEVAEVALELLLAGSPVDSLADSIPADVKLLDIYSIYRTVYVDLSAEFLTIPPEGMQLAVDAICATVLSQTEDYKLQLLIEGNGYDTLGPVKVEDPLPWPALNPDNSALADDIDPAEADRLRWYMPLEGSTLLVPRTLYYDAEQQDALELIASRIIPAGLKVTDILADADRIELVLELDAEAAYRSSAAYERAWVEAVCRSLCMVSSAESVQISFGGQGTLPKGLDISKPLSFTTPLNYIKL